MKRNMYCSDIEQLLAFAIIGELDEWNNYYFEQKFDFDLKLEKWPIEKLRENY